MQLERESEKFFLEREREVDSVAFLLMGEKAEAKWQRKRERERLGKKIGVVFNDKVSDRKWHCVERERYWFFFFREREVGTEQWALVGFCFYWVFFFFVEQEPVPHPKLWAFEVWWDKQRGRELLLISLRCNGCVTTSNNKAFASNCTGFELFV